MITINSSFTNALLADAAYVDVNSVMTEEEIIDALDERMRLSPQ